MSDPTTNQIKNKSAVIGDTVTDALNTLRTTQGDGSGDMLKVVYDTNNNGKVDVAEVAEEVPWTGVTSKPSTFPPQTHNHAISDVTSLQTSLDGKQATLESGVNIKTINGTSVLGSGDLVVSGGGGGVTDHGGLTGLADDDHTQYHNNARGDLRYSQLGHPHVTSDVTGLVTALAGKEPTITAGTTGQYWRGDKSWQDLESAVRAVLMTGVSFVTSSAVAAGDTLIQAIGKIQAQINGYAAAVLTFTNKRINPRVTSETSSATPTINTDNTDIHRITALAANITSFTTNLSGTPVHGQGLLVEIAGTSARTLSWGASFEAGTIALPTTTVSTNMLTVAFVWNSGTSKWRCVGVV